MTCTRGNTNKNLRGNTKQRRARRQYLVDTFGDGTTVECHLRISHACAQSATILTVDDVTIDCHPIPRHEGGTYVRENIRPACMPCQRRQGGLMSVALRKYKSQLKKVA
jgi:hypothetical protein